jgi:hypothetical protein
MKDLMMSPRKRKDKRRGIFPERTKVSVNEVVNTEKDAGIPGNMAEI